MKPELKTEILSIKSIDEWREANELMGRLLTHLKNIAIVEFKVGDKVKFKSHRTGEMIFGVVLKINSTTIRVDCGKNGLWKVSPVVLEKI